jgi:hypothetical protein
MTRISKEQFISEFQNGIDVNQMSEETKNALENVGIKEKQLAGIAGKDGKIEQKELERLYNAVDRFDNKKVDGHIEAYVNVPRVGFLPTPQGEAYIALQSDLARNITQAQIGGPIAGKPQTLPDGDRFLDQKYDSKHVENTLKYLEQEKHGEEFLLQLKENRTGKTVSTKGTDDTNGAYKELGAGYTTKEYNAVVSGLLKKEGGEIKNPEAASKLVYGSWGMEPFKRFEKEATKENKSAYIHAALVEPKFDSDTKNKIIEKLTAQKSGANNPTLEEVVRTAPEGSRKEITRLMSESAGFSDPKPPAIAKDSAKLTPEAQMKLARTTINNPDLPPEQKREALQNLMLSQNSQSLNNLIGKASAKEKQELAAVITGNRQLLERVGRHMTPENQKAVADQILNLGASKNVTGEALSIMMHPANMKGADANGMIDHFQKTGQLRDFVETQAGAPIAKTLLPCLNPQNAAAIQHEFRVLGQQAGEDKRVKNPENLGKTDSVEQENTNDHRVTHEHSKTREDTDHSSHTVGGEATGKLKVGIPFLVKGETEVKGSYSYETGHSTSTAETDALAFEYGQTYSTTKGTTYDRGEPERYNRDVDNQRRADIYARQVGIVDNFAAQHGEAYAQAYRKEAVAIHPD